MDPNANLRQQLAVAAQINAIVDNCTDDGHFSPKQLDELQGLAAQLAELVTALDGWISGSGFLPDRWQLAQNRADSRPACPACGQRFDVLAANGSVPGHAKAGIRCPGSYRPVAR